MLRYSEFLESSRPTRKARIVLRLLDQVVLHTQNHISWPDIEKMYEGTPSRWVYYRNGRAYFQYLKSFAGLTPSSFLLDIGSGLGRKAWPFMNFFETGEYLGLEPRVDAVAWCTENLTSKDAKLAFRHLDVSNGYYNQDGAAPASSIELPVADKSQDIVMVNSVFTHMLPADVAHYIQEISRVLRPGGRLLATFFLQPTHPSEMGPQVKPARYSFPFSRAGYRVQHDDCDEHVVSFHEQHITHLLQESGFRMRPVIWGSWHGITKYTDFQDIVIAEAVA